MFTEALQRLGDAMAGGVSGLGTLPELESVRGTLNGSAHGPTPHSPTTPRLRRRSRAMAVAVAVVAVAVASLVMALVPGPVGQKLPVAEAAQLRLIATNAARQPVIQLGSDQWLRMGEVSLVSLEATHQVPDGELDGKPVVTSRPIPDAAATVRVTSTEWYNSIGQACVSLRPGPITFTSSGANQAAWRKAGLRTRFAAPLAVCPDRVAANALNGFAQGIGAVDVSSLTSDPALPAAQLQSGGTGIPGLDQGAKTGNQGFEEAVALLTGPITGKPASFGATFYKAIALIPGIQKLGTTAARTGQVGLGFAGDTFCRAHRDRSQHRQAPRGAERIRSALPPVLNAPLPTGDLYPPSADPTAQGFSVTAQVKWSDSSGARSVVPTSAFPMTSNLHPLR